MKPYNPIIEGSPDHIAYFDENGYHCATRFCDGIPEECAVISADLYGLELLPILRCPECEAIYFGITRRAGLPPIEDTLPAKTAKPARMHETQPAKAQPETKEEAAIILPNLLTV